MGDWADLHEALGYDASYIPSYRKSGKAKAKKVISMSLTEAQYAKYKAIGGAVALRKLIEAASPSRRDR